MRFVLAEVESVLDLHLDSDVPLNAGLFDLGMDSLMYVEPTRGRWRGM